MGKVLFFMSAYPLTNRCLPICKNTYVFSEKYLRFFFIGCLPFSYKVRVITLWGVNLLPI